MQFNLSPILPASPSSLQLFAAFLAKSVSHRTIKVYLAAVRHWHILQGFPEPPDDPLLQYTLKGIKRQQGVSPASACPLPLLFSNALNASSTTICHFPPRIKGCCGQRFALPFMDSCGHLNSLVPLLSHLTPPERS